MLSIFEFRAAEKGLELAAFVHPQVPEVAVGDPSRFRQVREGRGSKEGGRVYAQRASAAF